MKGIKGRTLIKISLVLFTAIGLVLMNLYIRSNSSLYLYAFISCIFYVATTLLLISLKRIGNKKEKKQTKLRVMLSDLKEKIRRKKTDDEETPKKKRRLVNPYVRALIIRFTVYAIIVLSCVKNAVNALTGINVGSDVTVGFAVILLIMLAFLVVADKFCKHSEGNTPFVEAMLKNTRIFIKIVGLQFLLTAVCTVLCALQIFDIHKYAAYFFAVYFFYYLIFTLISLVIITIKKEFEEPYINIAIPFTDSDRGFGFIDYLENNTGITMRSLWSVKYIKKIAPITVALTVVLLWISTGIVQIEPYQEAAVYRFGVLRERTLDSGIHLTLPFPFDKTEIYDTRTLKKMTIGYKSSEPSDNVWTSSHGSDEYKLLLGNGDELVSINLRLEFRISDLKKYLRSASSPESVLEALAYELVTDKTITTDLSTLLSADRDAFADNFKKELVKRLSVHDTGLEVMCVILESIHPPVEIAAVYQQIVSAEITAEKYILDAQAKANVKKADAEAQRDTAVNTANAEHSEKTATAKSAVAEFVASLDAFNKYNDKYKYQKYLNAVREAYGKANLVILSEDVDGSAIYFGSFPDKETVTPETEE